jgi:crotonobetainyl-CoA:carnitine CoA-transferase CaiB-like acyl-CoA transferase
VRVVDLSKILAGPYVTMCLSDLGADVIKVEHPDGGDPTRQWGPPFQNGESTYFLAINRNKRSVCLDLKSDEGRAAVHRLLADADVMVENFRPGSSLARDFAYQELCERYPRLVVLHISAFGEKGPLRDEPGYDMVAQAAGGLMSLTGEPGGPPVKSGWAMGDLGAAVFGLSGVLAALYQRERTGRGQCVTTSLFEAQFGFHINWATGMFATGQPPMRLGSAHPSLMPYQGYAARDGHIVVAVGNDRQFAQLCEAIGRADLASDPRFATNRARVIHREELNAVLEPALRRQDCAYWSEELGARGVPVAPVQTLDETYASPQTAALELVGTIEHPTLGALRQVRFPVSFGGRRPVLRSAPPTLGQHSAEVLDEMRQADPA